MENWIELFFRSELWIWGKGGIGRIRGRGNFDRKLMYERRIKK